jgi:hypothetical protein
MSERFDGPGLADLAPAVLHGAVWLPKEVDGWQGMIEKTGC